MISVIAIIDCNQNVARSMTCHPAYDAAPWIKGTKIFNLVNTNFASFCSFAHTLLKHLVMF